MTAPPVGRVTALEHRLKHPTSGGPALVAYLTGRTIGAGAEYLTVFRVAGTAAFLGFAGASASESIWKAMPWSVTLKHIFDGLIYSLLTAGVFGWLWPS